MRWGTQVSGGHWQQQHCFSIPTASFLSSFDFVGINLKGLFVGINVLEGIWEGKSRSFMAMNGKFFSVAKGTVVSSEEVLIGNFTRGVMESDPVSDGSCSNAECQCWEEEVSCERVKTQRVITLCVCHSGSEKLCRKQNHRLGKWSCSNFSLALRHSYICCYQKKDKMVNEGWCSLTKNVAVWINRGCSWCYREQGYRGLKT